MAAFQSILYLDDQRVPTQHGVELVRNFDEFVQYLNEKGMPDLISFDHDLAEEHYPAGPNEAGAKINYSSFREKTGLHCARYIIDNDLDLRNWAVHSANVQGRINIERELRRYRRRGEVRDLQIPYEFAQPKRKSVPSVYTFSQTSLLQFQEAIPLESWENGLLETLAPR